MKSGNRVRFVCNLLKLMCTVGMVSIIPLRAAYWAVDHWGEKLIRLGKWYVRWTEFPLQAAPDDLRLYGFLIDLIPSLFFILFLYFLDKVLKNFIQFHFFSKNSISYIRKIGFLLLINQLSSPFVHALKTYILTPKGSPLIITLSGKQVFFSFFDIFMIFLFAYILEHGQYLKEEFDSTI